MADEALKNKQRKALNTADKRIRRTKNNLRSALFRLLERKDIGQITVSDIVREADINRSTFYFYYADIQDMIEQTNHEILDMFTRDIIATDSAFTKKEDFISYLVRYVDFCKNNYELCKFVTSNGCNNDLANRIRSELEKTIPNSAAIYDPADPRYYLTTYAISAFLYSILAWVDDGMKIEPEEMAKFLTEAYFSGSAYVKNHTPKKNTATP